MRLSVSLPAIRSARRYSSVGNGRSSVVVSLAVSLAFSLPLTSVLSIGLLGLTSGTAVARESSTMLPSTQRTPVPDDGASLLAPGVPSATLSDVVPPPSAAAIYLRTTLHVHDDVALCADALNRAVRRHPRYDRLLQLDRYQLHATQRHRDAIFSIGKPEPVDTIVTMKASARVRGHWQWQPVITRCGLRHGKVVATSIGPRPVVPKPTAKQRPRAGADYVEKGAAPSMLG